MDLKNYFKEQYPMPGLNGVEKLSAIYIVITLLLIATFFNELTDSIVGIIGARLAIIGVT